MRAGSDNQIETETLNVVSLVWWPGLSTRSS